MESPSEALWSLREVLAVERNIGGLLSKMLQRITILERRQARRSTGAGVGVPYGVPLPFLGPDSAIPDGYIKPMGQTVSRTTYAKLFAVFGTYYGAGNGSTTFVLPDLRGRALVGLHEGDSDFGTLGQKVGAKTHTLTAAEMPAHNHPGTAASAGAHTHPLNGGRAVVSTDAGVNLYTRGAAFGSMNVISMADGVSTTVTEPTNTSSAGAHTHSVSTNNQGGGGAHNNIPPSFVCPWILRY